MLTEMVEYGHKKKKEEEEKEVNAIKSKGKQNMQWTNSDGQKTKTQINGLEKKKDRNIQTEENEERRIQKKKWEA